MSRFFSKHPKIVAEEFNHFFSSAGKNTAIAASQIIQDNNFPNISPITLSNLHYPTNESEMFRFNSVSCSEVKNIITSMPTKQAPGKDRVRIIKHAYHKGCLPVILGRLTNIINASICLVISHNLGNRQKLFL